MSNRVVFIVTFVLVSSVAYAQHAISVEPETPQAVEPKPPAGPPMVVVQQPPQVQPVPQPAPKVEVNFPSELDQYIVPAATREVCTVMEWGFGEIRRDCRTEPIPIRAEDPALRGLCITRYGQRTCY